MLHKIILLIILFVFSAGIAMIFYSQVNLKEKSFAARATGNKIISKSINKWRYTLLTTGILIVTSISFYFIFFVWSV